VEEHPKEEDSNDTLGRPLFIRLAAFGLVTTLVYALFSYGGIRSPDSEIVFRTSEALATDGTFALTKELPRLQGFGLPKGEDGRFYSLFGPGESLAAVPLVKLALLIDRTRWYSSDPKRIPISHYVDNGITSFVNGETPEDIRPHALRSIVSVFNIIVGAFCVCCFFLLVRLLTRSDFSSWLTTILFAFGSLAMPYADTFFSEPLATTLVILSLCCLVWNDVSDHQDRHTRIRMLVASGIFLGMATTVHITAILYAPFFYAYAVYPFLRTERTIKEFVTSSFLFSSGVFFFLCLLGYYNFVRFGDILETGRTAAKGIYYATYVAPWQGLYGLLLSSGKGLVWFCPAVVAGIALWRPFHKRHTFLSWTILAAVVFRICYIASRSDWHGGFSLGPRYLVMAVPLLLLPIGTTIVQWATRRSLRSLWLFSMVTLACVAEQLYFSVGEVFSFLHTVKWTYLAHGINVFDNDSIYLDWDKSPLLYLLDARRGSYLLRSIPVDNYTLLWWCILATSIILFLVYARLFKTHIGRWY
jgi:hypothetical protein